MKRFLTVILFAMVLLGAIATMPAARGAFAASGPITQANSCGMSHCSGHDCKSDCNSSSCPCH